MFGKKMQEIAQEEVKALHRKLGVWLFGKESGDCLNLWHLSKDTDRGFIGYSDVFNRDKNALEDLPVGHNVIGNYGVIGMCLKRIEQLEKEVKKLKKPVKKVVKKTKK